MKANSRLTLKKGKPAKLVMNRNLKKGDVTGTRKKKWQDSVRAKRPSTKKK